MPPRKRPKLAPRTAIGVVLAGERVQVMVGADAVVSELREAVAARQSCPIADVKLRTSGGFLMSPQDDDASIADALSDSVVHADCAAAAAAAASAERPSFLGQMAAKGWAVVPGPASNADTDGPEAALLASWHSGTRPAMAVLEPAVEGKSHVTISHANVREAAGMLPQCDALVRLASKLQGEIVDDLYPSATARDRRWLSDGLTDEADKSIVSSFRYASRGFGLVLCPAHVDKGVLTVVTAGHTLRVRDKHGEWVSLLPSGSKDLVVFGGTVLEHLSGGKYPAIEHRVVSDGWERNVVVVKVRARDLCVVGPGGAYPPLPVAEIMRRFDATHDSVNLPAAVPVVSAPSITAAPTDGKPITLRVKDQTGEETFFKVKRSTPLEKVSGAIRSRRLLLPPFSHFPGIPCVCGAQRGS